MTTSGVFHRNGNPVTFYLTRFTGRSETNGGNIYDTNNTLEIPEDAIYIVDSSTTLNKEFQVVPKYIDDCIKAKELLPLESYIVRRAGESPPSTSRNNFTAEEDQLLLRIVRAKEAEGLKTGGIKLYNNIADLFPRHTPQSLRQRYLKCLLNKTVEEEPLTQAREEDPKVLQEAEPFTQAEARIDSDMDADDILMANLLTNQIEKEKDNVVDNLKHQISQLAQALPQHPIQVIFYALYTMSGDFEKAEEFLKNPSIVPLWSVLDDELLIVSNDLVELKKRHSVATIRERCEFMHDFLQEMKDK